MNRNVTELQEIWMLSGKEKSLKPAENLNSNPRNQPVTCSLDCLYTQGVSGGRDKPSGECSLC